MDGQCETYRYTFYFGRLPRDHPRMTVKKVSQKTYYESLAKEPDADFCPICNHITDAGWGFVEYCPKCGWNSKTGRPD